MRSWSPLPEGRRQPARPSTVANANGEWEQGASAYEKRAAPLSTSPEWDVLQSALVETNIQCASHATIRPFQLTADELAAFLLAKSRDNKPANEYKFQMAVSPSGLHGPRRVRHRLPHSRPSPWSRADKPGRSAGSVRPLRCQHPKKPSKVC